MKNEIGTLLIKLGISRTYLGHLAVLYAVMLVIEDETRLLNVIRKIYQPVSEILCCNVGHIERNIRTVIFIAWTHNRALLDEVAGVKLSAPPVVSQFIDMLANYVVRSCAADN